MINKNDIEPIKSLGDLRSRSYEDDTYANLAITGAKNLGLYSKDGFTECGSVDAIQYLETLAMETSEEGVVEEVNFVRSLVES